MIERQGEREGGGRKRKTGEKEIKLKCNRKKG